MSVISNPIMLGGTSLAPERPFLEFSCAAGEFSIRKNAGTKSWDGTLEYSTDATTWTVWAGAETLNSSNGLLYLRGSGNTKICERRNPQLLMNAAGSVSCRGNIETLLDWQLVLQGDHPQMAADCFYALFSGCTQLVKGPDLPATTLSSDCYQYLFRGTGLREAPSLPAMVMAESCYAGMFAQSALQVAPALPATTLAADCYREMFWSTLIELPPALPATALASFCYKDMFSSCVRLMEAPALPAMTLATGCYWHMFGACSALRVPPDLPATTLARQCYQGMFSSSGIRNCPALPALTLDIECYYDMFANCLSIETAPALPAMTLATGCYHSMFSGSSITLPPALPATTLATSCYRQMFGECRDLVAIPELSAEILPGQCCMNMFTGCTKVRLSASKIGQYTHPIRIPSTGTGQGEEYALEHMFSNTGGTFTGTPTINVTYYTDHDPIPAT